MPAEDIGPEIVPHGEMALPGLRIDSYNVTIRDKDGFVGDRANKGAFQSYLREWRRILQKTGDPFPGDPLDQPMTKARLDEILIHGDWLQRAAIHSAVERFAAALAAVIERYLRLKPWKRTERIVIGGGFQSSSVGELAVGRAQAILAENGHSLILSRIRNTPNEAGLVGAVRLIPPEHLAGFDTALAVDLGGTNVRCGLVPYTLQKGNHFEGKVRSLHVWRHGEERMTRTALIEGMAGMLAALDKEAATEGIRLAPYVAIGCPGLIKDDGTIEAGTQNLPGNWGGSFHLGRALHDLLPVIGGHDSVFVVHNDAVVQGLSEWSQMRDVKRWGVLTIGTGLGNAHFTNMG